MSAKKVTKYDLVEAVYKDTNYERKMVQDVADHLLDEIKQSLGNGNTIELRGFGTFEPRLRKGRSRARNPKTGEDISSVAPHYFAVFRSGHDLKKNLMSLAVQS